MPLVVASGAGAGGRQVMGIVVVAGVSAATFRGIFFFPALFVFVERISGHKDQPVKEQEGSESEAPPTLSHAE